MAAQAAPVLPLQHYAENIARSLGCEAFPVKGKRPAPLSPRGVPYQWGENALGHPGVHDATPYAWKVATGIAVTPIKGDTLAYLDIDDPALVDTFVSALPELRETYIVGRDTHRHYYVKLHSPLDGAILSMRNAAGEEIASLRGAGAYVVAAGSQHPAGGRYELQHVGQPIQLTEGQSTVLLALFNDTRPKLAREPRPAQNVNLHGSSNDYRRAKDNLARFAPWRASNYQEWIAVGRCLYGLGEAGFALWDSWSATCKEKYDPEICRQKWATFAGCKGNLRAITKKANEDDPAGMWTSKTAPVIPAIPADLRGAEPAPSPTQVAIASPLNEIPTGIMRAVEFLTKNVTLAKLIRAGFALPENERCTPRTAREWAELADAPRSSAYRALETDVARCFFGEAVALADLLLSNEDTVSTEVRHYTFNDLATIREWLHILIDERLHRQVYHAKGGPAITALALAADVPESEARTQVGKVNERLAKLPKDEKLDRRFDLLRRQWCNTLQDMTPAAQVSSVTDAQVVKTIQDKPRTSALEISRRLGIDKQRVYRAASEAGLIADFTEPEIEIKRGRDLRQHFDGMPFRVDIERSDGRLVSTHDYTDLDDLADKVDLAVKRGHTVRVKIRVPNGFRPRTEADDQPKEKHARRPVIKLPYVWQWMINRLEALACVNPAGMVDLHSDDRYRQLWAILAGDASCNPPLESKPMYTEVCQEKDDIEPLNIAPEIVTAPIPGSMIADAEPAPIEIVVNGLRLINDLPGGFWRSLDKAPRTSSLFTALPKTTSVTTNVQANEEIFQWAGDK